MTAAFVDGVAMIAFQVWLLFEPQQPRFERPVHLAFGLVLLFLYKPLTDTRLPGWLRITLDAAAIAVSVAVLGYYLIGFERLTTRMENVSPIFGIDFFFGALLVFLLLEGSRRAVGWVLVWVLLVFITYAFWGNVLPGWLNFRGFGIEAATEITTMTTAGVLGITTSTSVSFVFYFILFGAFNAAVDGGQLFIDLAIRAAGRATGGTAKAAIIGSSLMGSISGSAVANVVSTGVFTIPLMKRTARLPTAPPGSKPSPPPAGNSCRRSWAWPPSSWPSFWGFHTRRSRVRASFPPSPSALRCCWSSIWPPAAPGSRRVVPLALEARTLSSIGKTRSGSTGPRRLKVGLRINTSWWLQPPEPKRHICCGAWPHPWPG